MLVKAKVAKDTHHVMMMKTTRIDGMPAQLKRTDRDDNE
jgi:hypothetical protein